MYGKHLMLIKWINISLGILSYVFNICNVHFIINKKYIMTLPLLKWFEIESNVIENLLICYRMRQLQKNTDAWNGRGRFVLFKEEVTGGIHRS